MRLVDVPASATEDIRARQYIVDHLEPGATIERRIEISNTTSHAATVAVYTAAAGIANGTFLGEEGRSANGLSSWTTLGTPTMTIAANSTALNTVTLAIPSDAAPGEQYAAVWVEARGDDSGTIEIVNRVGIRMYVSVGGANPASSFTVDSLTASRDATGRAVVTAAVHNTGERALDATATLTLAKVGASLAAGPYDSDRTVTIAPGDTAPLPIVLSDDMDEGPWNAEFVVSSGLLTGEAEAQLTFPDTGEGVRVAPDAPMPIAIWFIAGFLFVLVIVVTTFARSGRKKRELTP